MLSSNLLPLSLAETLVSPSGLPQPVANNSAISTVLAIVFGIIGALALVIIVIAGMRYITSAGDPQKASGAKNSIIYALVGLVIAISAESIVVFVVGKT